MNVMSITRFAQKCTIDACLHCVSLATHVLLSGQFFLSKKNLSNLMVGALGSIRDGDFYVGMQNQMRIESQTFYSHLKYAPWSDSYMFVQYREAFQFQCLTPTRYVNGRGHVHTTVTTITKFALK